jgi:hypothetical protein
MLDTWFSHRYPVFYPISIPRIKFIRLAKNTVIMGKIHQFANNWWGIIPKILRCLCRPIKMIEPGLLSQISETGSSHSIKAGETRFLVVSIHINKILKLKGASVEDR